METWHDFFVAVAGAAAALTGLIFVGVSISLERILSFKRLPNRASSALILLTTVIIVSLLCITPQHSACLLGIELWGIGIIVWIMTFRLELGIFRDTDKQYRKAYSINILFTQLSVLPYIVAGILLLSSGFEGIYWLIPSIIFSLIKSISDAWVLLIEINR